MLALVSMCWSIAGCSPQPAISDQQAAKQLLSSTLEAWKSGKTIEELKQQSPPVYVGDERWSTGAKLVEFSLTSDGEFHQSSVRIPVRMKTSKDAKPKEVSYWVSTNPANTVTLAE